jgi:uncharacterized membrane protein YkvA (DUF1232 family)
MRAAEIREQINAAIEHERTTNRLREILAQLATAQGRRASASELDSATGFIREYIEQVPATMEALAKAEQKLGGSVQLHRVLSAAEQYWFTAFDIIPDQLGLTGLLDDAYYVLTLMHGISEAYRERTGISLLSPNLGPANIWMRSVIGEPGASILDAAIHEVREGPAIRSLRAELFGMIGRPVSVPDPIWGNASVQEIASARLGALGIV